MEGEEGLGGWTAVGVLEGPILALVKDMLQSKALCNISQARQINVCLDSLKQRWTQRGGSIVGVPQGSASTKFGRWSMNAILRINEVMQENMETEIAKVIGEERKCIHGPLGVIK